MEFFSCADTETNVANDATTIVINRNRFFIVADAPAVAEQ